MRGAELRLKKRARLPRVSLQLNQNRRRGRVFYEAGIDEKRGAIGISRRVVGHLPGGSFSFEGDLGRAEFDGVGPFSGSGLYAAAPGGPRWSGSLSVDFPGRAGVALTGSGFDVSLFHARRSESK